MKPFLTVDNSRTKRAHIVYRSKNTGELTSLCKTTDAGDGPYGKTLEHSPHLHEHLPEGYSLCRTCLLKAYDSDLLHIDYLFNRSLVEVHRGLFMERPLTVEEYERDKNED